MVCVALPVTGAASVAGATISDGFVSTVFSVVELTTGSLAAAGRVVESSGSATFAVFSSFGSGRGLSSTFGSVSTGATMGCWTSDIIIHRLCQDCVASACKRCERDKVKSL